MQTPSPTPREKLVCPNAPFYSAKKARLNYEDKQTLSARLFDNVFEPITDGLLRSSIVSTNNGYQTPEKQERELVCPDAPNRRKIQNGSEAINTFGGNVEQYELASVVRRFPM
jgi:hypothetical protein